MRSRLIIIMKRSLKNKQKKHSKKIKASRAQLKLIVTFQHFLIGFLRSYNSKLYMLHLLIL